MDYREFVGPPDKYDIMSATQFNLMTFLGLRENHYMLDIGCGSLRGGRLYIPYLLPEHYFGIEPQKGLVDEGIEHETGKDLINVKKPTFSNDSNFTLTLFKRNFDYLLAQSIFSHASKKQIIRCFSEANKVMDIESVFVASFFESEEDYEKDDWIDPGYTFYRFETIERMALENNLKIKRVIWPHPNQQTWILIQKKESEKTFDTGEENSKGFSREKIELDKCMTELKAIKKSKYVRLGLYIFNTKESLKRKTRKKRLR